MGVFREIKTQQYIVFFDTDTANLSSGTHDNTMNNLSLESYVVCLLNPHIVRSDLLWKSEGGFVGIDFMHLMHLD